MTQSSGKSPRFEIFEAARVRASDMRPYFARALAALYPVKLPGLETMAVDMHGRVYWDPDVIGGSKGWTIEQTAWVLIHELGHWLREHHVRATPLINAAACRTCATRLTNYAEDAELNDDLIAEGAKLPGTPYTPQLLGLQPNRTFEEYYAAIVKRAQDHQHDGRVLCGSAAHGVPQPYELPVPQQDDPLSVSEGEAHLIRREVARQIQSQGIGSVGWRRWADKMLTPPQVSWERELSAVVKNAVVMARGAADYDYTRIGRRGTFQKVLMPAMRSPQVEVVVVVDTSGSMSENRELPLALVEIKAILRACGQRQIPVICCEDAPSAVQIVNNVSNLQLIGGGGTDMGAGIQAADKLKPAVIIVLTDMFTDWPEHAPKAKLVIGAIGDDNRWFLDSLARAPIYAQRVVRIRAPREAGDDDDD